MDYYYYEYENDNKLENDDVQNDYYEYSMYLNDESLTDVYKTCILPSTTQITRYIGLLLSCSLSYHMLRYLLEKLWPTLDIWYHLCSIAFGFLMLNFALGREWLLMLFMCLFIYMIIVTLSNHQFPRLGMAIAIFTILIQIILEYFITQYVEWQKIRGIQMVATMKMISFAYDFEMASAKKRSVYKLSLLLSYLGYIFCPTTCLLGPWVPYNNYMEKQQILLPNNKNRLFRLATNAFLAVIFLNSSNCLIPWIRSKYMTFWTYNYFDALSVRCSHYFIGFLSQAIVMLDGTAAINANYKVVQPLQIEFPRSLHSLVRYWNIPMHEWLKMYIFRPLQTTYGSYFISIALTYVVSALLHGFHTEVHFVLLSLAGFTYVENVLRSTLARVYDACLDVNGCNKICSYTYCAKRQKWSLNALLIRFINFMFSILTIINLTYLGIIMPDNETTDKYEGIAKWHRLKYFGHWINLAMYIFYLCI